LEADMDFEAWAMVGVKGGVEATCEIVGDTEFVAGGSFIRPDGIEVFRYFGPSGGYRYFTKKGANHIHTIFPSLACFSIGYTAYVEMWYDVEVLGSSIFKWVAAFPPEPSVSFHFKFLDSNGAVLPGGFGGPNPGHVMFKTAHPFVYRGERKNFAQSYSRDYPFTWNYVATILGRSIAPLKVVCVQ
jgi:hypothetical protein